MTRHIFQRCMVAGESMDHSVSSIYPEHVASISKALSLSSHPEAAKRKFAFRGLESTAGRPIEVGFITHDSLSWDAHFKVLIGEAPQSKPSKVKLLAFMAGVNQYYCYFTDWGDALIADRGSSVYSNQQGSWLFPEVHHATSSSTLLSRWLQALLPEARGGQQQFRQVAVDSLPPNPTAAGFRPGAINTFATGVPAEFAAHLTGHDLKKISALWEYMCANIALLMPAGVVLAGKLPSPPCPHSSLHAHHHHHHHHTTPEHTR